MVQHSYAVSAHPPGPIRTCVGCRTRVLSVDLLRFVGRPSGDGTQVIPDPKRRLPGRGGWIHRTSECLRNAERRRAFGRALKVSGRLDLAELEIAISSAAPCHVDQHTEVAKHLEKKRQQQS